MHYYFLAIMIVGLLFASISGALAQSGPAFSTYQAWEFGALGDVLATSSIEDVSGDGAGDVVVALGKSISLIDGATGEKVWTYVSNEVYIWTEVMGFPDASDDGLPEVLAASNDRIFMLDGAAGGQLWNFSTGSTPSDLCFPSTRSMHEISETSMGTPCLTLQL